MFVLCSAGTISGIEIITVANFQDTISKLQSKGSVYYSYDKLGRLESVTHENFPEKK